MRAGWLIAAAFTLAVQLHAARAADPVVQVDFSNPELVAPAMDARPARRWQRPFSLADGQDFPDDGQKEMERTRRGPRYPGERANSPEAFLMQRKRHNWFNEPCESHLKVAFRGMEDAQLHRAARRMAPAPSTTPGTRKSKRWEIRLNAVAETILEGARLELLLQHDRLGLDQEMEFLTEAVGDGRAQQICAIREILERLAQDDGVLERVRKRARALLAHGST